MSDNQKSLLDYFDVKKDKNNRKNVAAAAGTLLMVAVLIAMIGQSALSKNKTPDLPPVDSSYTASSASGDTDSGEDKYSDTVSEYETETDRTDDTDSGDVSSKASVSSESPASSKSASSKKAAASSKSSSTASQSTTVITTTPGARQGTSQGGGSSAGSTTSSQTTPAVIPEPSVIPAVHDEERFDEYGRLIIDTDTLDGKKAIAITFDDGPSQYTRELIEGLNARGAHATFFIVGSRVSWYPDILPLIVEGGHQLGNHTYNHVNMPSVYESTWRGEISATDDAVYNACGQYPTAFRPPYGAYTEYMARSVDKTFTMWSVDTLDWQSRNTQSVKDRILSQARDGSIVLLHDLYKTSVDAALSAIDQLQQQGYVFVTVDELMTRYGYPISNTAQFKQYPVENTVFIPKEEPATDSEQPEVPDTDEVPPTDSEAPTPDTDTDTYTDTDTDTEIVSDSDTDAEEENTDAEEVTGEDTEQ